MEEKEISFLKILKYIFRKWFVWTACAVVGITAGVIYAVGYQTTDIHIYETRITVSTMNYRQLYIENKTDETLSEGDYSTMNAHMSEIMSTVSDSIINSRVLARIKTDTAFDTHRAQFYPKLKENERQKKFLKNCKAVVDREAKTVSVLFAYDYKDKTKDAAMMAAVLDIYAEEAMKSLVERYPESDNPGDTAISGAKLIEARVISVSGPEENKNVSAFSQYFEVESNERPSPYLYALIGGVIGLIAGFIVGLIIYFADGHIKSIKDKLNEENDKVIAAVNDLSDTETLFNRLDAACLAKLSEGVLLVTDKPNDKVLKFAASYAAHLAEQSFKVLYVDFYNRSDSDFDTRVTVKHTGYVRYFALEKAFNEDIKNYDAVIVVSDFAGAYEYSAGYVKNAVYLIDHANTKNKTYIEALNANAAVGAKNMGTLLYGVTKSYLD